MSFSIDGGVYRAWSVDDISIDAAAGFLDVPRAVAAERLATLRAELADPAAVARVLETLPAPTVAVLGVIAGEGGLALMRDVVQRAGEAFGLSAEQVRLAMAPAIRSLLAVPLGGSTVQAFALVAPTASTIGALLVDLDIADLPAGSFDAPAAGRSRDLIAACMALDTIDVKLTITTNRPHRGSLKRLAKQIGATDDALDRMICTGIAFGLVGTTADDVLRPDVAALTRFAAGTPDDPFLATLIERARDAPLPLEQVMRWMMRCGAFASPDVLEWVPGLAVGAVAGRRAIATVSVGGTPSAHVTPNFEIFVPPESADHDLVAIGRCADVVRIDRMVVARLTKSSVARAASSGLDAAAIVALLGDASRTPIPQNVEVAIRDWAADSATATMTTGTVIVVDAKAAGRVARVLGDRVRSVAPGVFVADPDEPLPRLARDLDAIGIRIATPTPVHGFDVAAAVRARLAGMTTASPALRARVTAWKRGEAYDGKRDDFLETHRLHRDPVTAPRSDADEREIAAIELDLYDWEAEHDLELDDDVVAELARALARFDDDIRSIILGQSGSVATLRAAIARGTGARGTGTRGVSRIWRDDRIRLRLEAAARDGATLAVRTPTVERTMRIERVARRGSAWMVFGEDIDNAASIALPVASVTCVAEVAARWLPALGEQQPAGHLPCPCGSGERYRRCCRDLD